MRRILLITLAFLVSYSLAAEDDAAASGGSGSPKGADRGVLQSAKSVEETEKGLDKTIAELNEKLKNHTKLFRMKVSNQPHRTFLYKGKAKGDECEKAENQEAADNDCMKLEVFSFVGAENGYSELNLGSKYKYVTLFFEGGVSEEDPRLAQPGNVKKIISKVYVNKFKEFDLKVSEVVDNAPTDKEHKDVTILFQHDGDPAKGANENKSVRGRGLYKLAEVENTKTNPTRNQFKKTYYIKHLDYFDKLFTYLFDSNDQNGNKRYKMNNETLKNSLKY